MHTSNSSPVRFIGQAPLPEFDYSQQPLPDNIQVLLWMLDGAERRHRLVKSWRATDDLHVEVDGDEVMVALPELSTASGKELPRGGGSTVSHLASGVRRKSLEARQREGKRAGVDRVRLCNQDAATALHH